MLSKMNLFIFNEADGRHNQGGSETPTFVQPIAKSEAWLRRGAMLFALEGVHCWISLN